MTVMDHINRIAPRELGAWLKDRLADEMPLLCMRLEETTAQSIIKSYEREMPTEIKRVLVLACVELVREFLRTPDAAADYYAEELMRLACGIGAPVSDEAHMLVAQSTFAALSKAKQVAVLSIVRKQPHEYSYWTELDRRTEGKLRNVIASCMLDLGLAEFIRFMPQIVDEPPGADVLILLLETRLRHKAPADREQLLQMIREGLPQCCASIQRSVAEWFHEERIPGANVDGSHVSMSAGMGAMCGSDDDKPVYDGSVSLSYADGREIGCAKCRELFVEDVKSRPPTSYDHQHQAKAPAMSRPTPVGRIVIRPSDDTKAIIGITKGADPSLKPGMVYEIRKDDSGVMTLHEVGESCIRGPVAAEDMRSDAVFSWAHDLGLIFDQMGVECVAAIGEPRHRAQLDIIMQHQKHDMSYPNMSDLGYAGVPVLEFFFPAFAAAHSKPKDLEDELRALFRAIDDGNHDGADQMIKGIGEKWTEKLSELVRATVSNQRKRAYSEQKESKS